MEDVTLPNVGASFEKWGCYIPIFPKCQAISILPKNGKNKK
jgi:hypothetical protein